MKQKHIRKPPDFLNEGATSDEFGNNQQKNLIQVFWQFEFTIFPPNIADLAQQKLYINANLYGTQATVCSMYYCRVKCKKAQPDFAQFSSTAFNIFRSYEKYSDNNEVAGNENPIVNM